MNICLFEDKLAAALTPINLCRPTYAITCGSIRLLDLALQLGGKVVGGHLRPHLTEFEQDYFPQSEIDAEKPTLWLNARLIPTDSLFQTLQSLMQRDDEFIFYVGDEVALARTDVGKPEPALVSTAEAGDQSSHEQHSATIDQTLRELDLPIDESCKARLFERPDQVITEHTEVMAENLAWRLKTFSGYQEPMPKVFTRGDVSIHPQTELDTSKGPIVLEDGVSIGPFSVLRGPIYLSENTHVNPHALLKGPISVGHTCKIGGEISSSVIEAYSNKSHFGYLGTSYVGSWVNLGAGTTNSNLKNTYGTIRVEATGPDGSVQKIDTGRQFLGCVIGDYTKTAIHTAIFTGKTLGVCSNVYGTVTKNVPSFANYAQSFGQVTEHSADVMIVTQKRVFDRRGIQQEERHRKLIRAIYALESPKRSLPNKPLSL